MIRIFSLLLVLCLVVPPSIASPAPSAVEREAGRELAHLFNAHKVGDARPGDYQAAATSLRILFAEYEENGTNKGLQEQLNSLAGDFPNQVREPDDVFSSMVSMGAIVTKQELRDHFSQYSLEQGRAFARHYAHAGGIEEIEAAMISALVQKSAQVTERGATKAAWVCEFSGLVALYSFVISVVCLVCAPIAAIIGGVSSIVAFIAC